jgi:hypothetical protein
VFSLNWNVKGFLLLKRNFLVFDLFTGTCWCKAGYLNKVCVHTFKAA